MAGVVRQPQVRQRGRLAGGGLLLTGLLGATAAAVLLSEGDIAVGLAPLVTILALYAVWRTPARVTAYTVMFMSFIAENPLERPAMGLWESPLYPLGRLLYINLNKIVGVGALAFCLLDLVFIGLVGLMWLRRFLGNRIDARGNTRAHKPLTEVLMLALVTICWLEVYGIARGGDFKNSLWQIRPLLLMPIVAYVMTEVTRGPRDFGTLGALVIVSALVKAAKGFYFYFAIAKPMGTAPAFVTSHADTVLFVMSIVVCIAIWFEYRTRASAWLAIIVIPIVSVVIVLNNRRLAWVALFACLFTVFTLIERRIRMQLVRAGLAFIPFILVYGAIGWSSTNIVFKPVAMVRSVVSQDDRSSGTRDIENYNLIQTLKQNPLGGSGFGHEYLELVHADDISQFFAQYRYIAHNSVLWLWSIGGLIGFGGYWLLLVACMLFAMRAYKRSTQPSHRVAMMCAISAIICYMAESWGDMGMLNWTGVGLVSIAVACTSKLTVLLEC